MRKALVCCDNVTTIQKIFFLCFPVPFYGELRRAPTSTAYALGPKSGSFCQQGHLATMHDHKEHGCQLCCIRHAPKHAFFHTADAESDKYTIKWKSLYAASCHRNTTLLCQEGQCLNGHTGCICLVVWSRLSAKCCKVQERFHPNITEGK